MCNQVAGFKCCITKLQTDIQDNLRSLEFVLERHSSQKNEKAMTEICDLTVFNQNISFCFSRRCYIRQIHSVQMRNITLLRRDAYLDHLRPGVKPETWCALHSPLNSSGLFLDDMVSREETEIAKAEAEHRSTQPGSGNGGYSSRKQNRYQPHQGGWNRQ